MAFRFIFSVAFSFCMIFILVLFAFTSGPVGPRKMSGRYPRAMDFLSCGEYFLFFLASCIAELRFACFAHGMHVQCFAADFLTFSLWLKVESKKNT